MLTRCKNWPIHLRVNQQYLSTKLKQCGQLTNTEVDYADTCTAQDVAHWCVVHHVWNEMKIISRIPRCHISKSDHRQDENSREVLENWINLSDCLYLVPLIRNEVSTPYGHRHFIRAITTTKWNDFTLRSFPVNEENINARLSTNKRSL